MIDDMIDLQDNAPAAVVVGGEILVLWRMRRALEMLLLLILQKGLLLCLKGDVDFEFEPCDGIEFQSHEESYSFYQEYAKSTAFATSIKNSRWSQKS
jgi:hypothetical protein